MKILFIGNVLFSKYMLENILGQISSKKINLIGIITKEQSEFNSDHVNLSYIAIKYNIEYRYVRDINSEKNVEWIRSLNPDVILCLGWSSIIKKEVLNIPNFGVIGFHPSMLPHNRGRHPIIWALALGLKETGSTFFLMDEGVDSGPIISQARIDISFEDDAFSLYQKIIKTASKQLVSIFDKILTGTIKSIPQHASNTNSWRKRSKSDGIIDFRMSSLSIYNLVRALSEPYPNANLLYEGNIFKVKRAIIGTNMNSNIEPGKVISIMDREIEVKTSDTSIKLVDHDIISLPYVGSYII